MSTFVFSDTHFTKRFSQKKFNKLKELIESHDTIIINGDFWEGLSISFDEFMNSKWKELFPLLKSKRAIYIYGNHDVPELSDDRVYEFCEVAVNEYLHETKKQNYFFTHGQEFLTPKVPKEKKEYKQARSLYKRTDIFIAEIIQTIMFKVLGANAFPKRFNRMTLETRRKVTSLDNLLVCGHSHTPEFQKELNFMDIGFFNYGWANYLIIENNGDYTFHSEKY